MNIINKFIRINRMYITFDLAGKRQTLPFANYIWLKGNPSFEAIPKGYVIHHLDLDPLNDDISNLVLMFKHHHTAYHLKYKTVEVPIECNVAFLNSEMGLDWPTRCPRVYKRPKTQEWFLSFYLPTGKKKGIYQINKKKFYSKEEAVKSIDFIWPNNNWGATKALLNNRGVKK